MNRHPANVPAEGIGDSYSDVESDNDHQAALNQSNSGHTPTVAPITNSPPSNPSTEGSVRQSIDSSESLPGEFESFAVSFGTELPKVPQDAIEDDWDLSSESGHQTGQEAPTSGHLTGAPVSMSFEMPTSSAPVLQPTPNVAVAEKVTTIATPVPPIPNLDETLRQSSGSDSFRPGLESRRSANKRPTALAIAVPPLPNFRPTIQRSFDQALPDLPQPTHGPSSSRSPGLEQRPSPSTQSLLSPFTNSPTAQGQATPTSTPGTARGYFTLKSPWLTSPLGSLFPPRSPDVAFEKTLTARNVEIKPPTQDFVGVVLKHAGNYAYLQDAVSDGVIKVDTREHPEFKEFSVGDRVKGEYLTSLDGKPSLMAFSDTTIQQSAELLAAQVEKFEQGLKAQFNCGIATPTENFQATVAAVDEGRVYLRQTTSAIPTTRLDFLRMPVNCFVETPMPDDQIDVVVSQNQTAVTHHRRQNEDLPIHRIPAPQQDFSGIVAKVSDSEVWLHSRSTQDNADSAAPPAARSELDLVWMPIQSFASPPTRGDQVEVVVTTDRPLVVKHNNAAGESFAIAHTLPKPFLPKSVDCVNALPAADFRKFMSFLLKEQSTGLYRVTNWEKDHSMPTTFDKTIKLSNGDFICRPDPSTGGQSTKYPQFYKVRSDDAIAVGIAGQTRSPAERSPSAPQQGNQPQLLAQRQRKGLV